MDVDMLVAAVKRFPAIYDARDKKHNDRDYIIKAWSCIAQELNCTVDTAKKKWKGLRDTFRGELRKLPNGRSLEAGTPVEAYASTWPHFKLMFFLKDHMSSRKSGINLESIVQDFACGTRQENEEFDMNGSPTSFATSYASPSVAQQVEDLTASGLHFPNNRLQLVNKKRRITKMDDVEDQILEIERRKIDILESRLGDGVPDEDRMFLLSLLPEMKKLSAHKKFYLRMKMQELVYNHVYGSEYESPSSACVSPGSVVECAMSPQE